MKVDLTSLLKDGNYDGFSQEGFKRHISQSVVELIRLELESLPKEEWSRTLKTWSKICYFAESLSKKDEKERQELYRKFQFDAMMVHITESIIEKLKTARSVGLLKEAEKPDKLISLGLELAEDSEEIRFMKDFFGVP